MPQFLYQLVTQVNWTVESTCLNNICCILARFYSVSASFNDCSIGNDINDQNDSDMHNEHIFVCTNANQTHQKPNIKLSKHWMLEHSLWPALTSTLIPSKHFPNSLIFDKMVNDSNKENRYIDLKSSFVLLTSLADLYKVFERC